MNVALPSSGSNWRAEVERHGPGAIGDREKVFLSSADVDDIVDARQRQRRRREHFFLGASRRRRHRARSSSCSSTRGRSGAFFFSSRRLATRAGQQGGEALHGFLEGRRKVRASFRVFQWEKKLNPLSASFSLSSVSLFLCLLQSRDVAFSPPPRCCEALKRLLHHEAPALESSRKRRRRHEDDGEQQCC